MNGGPFWSATALNRGKECLCSLKVIAGNIHQFPCLACYGAWFKTELLLKLLQGSRRAERLHANDTATSADVSFPAEGRSLFHRYARCHLGLVARDLIFEVKPSPDLH